MSEDNPMDKITPEDPITRSADVVNENLEQLKGLFPDAFTEGKVDFDVLKQLLGGEVDEREEKYGLNWHGKRQARQLALTPSTGTLRPCPEESVDWDSTQNLMIEGDNLEVLKLLQKSYSGKVKLIYIDPPYNTGGDFVYSDNFADSISNYMHITGQLEGEDRRLSSNTEASGRFHTRWLSMMLPRLMAARNLLTNDGSIFVSIDDNEAASLKLLLSEIFGEENYIASIAWNHTKQSKNDERHFSRHYNQILVYGKASGTPSFRLERSDADNKNYSNPDNDPRGLWRSGDVRSPSLRSTACYPLETPSGNSIPHPENGWRWKPETMASKIESGEVIFTDNETRIVRKIFLSEQKGRTPENLWCASDAGTTRQATRELKELFGKSPFDTPKPTSLIRKIASLATEPLGGDIVLDFFAGSGTTGHAVASLNQSDGGNRKFILVQIPQPFDADDKDQRAAAEICNEKNVPHNIAELTKERLRRVNDSLDREAGLDSGFRVFKLSQSNIKSWNANPEDLEQELFHHVAHITTDRTSDDVFYELLLKLGLDLCTPIAVKSITGKHVQAVGAGTLMVCLEEAISAAEAEGLAEGIAEWHGELAPAGESTVIFRDSAFGSDDIAKANVVAILKQRGLKTVRSL